MMPILLFVIAAGLLIIAGLSLLPNVNHQALQAVGFFLAGAALVVLWYGGR